MKKLFLALGLLSTGFALNAENAAPSETSQAQFLAKITTTLELSTCQYSSVRELFKACISSYITTHEHLKVINASSDIDAINQAAGIKSQLDPVGEQLQSTLSAIKKITAQMEEFNELQVEQRTYALLTDKLITVMQKLTSIKESLEPLHKQQETLEQQAASLRHSVESQA